MAFPPVQAAPQAIPTPSAPIGPPNARNALQSGYTTPSGIPALPRPQLQMSETDVKLWWDRYSDDKARRDLEKPLWQGLMHAYQPPSYGNDYTDLNSNIHFRNVHLKQSELWAQFPDLVLTPLGPLKGIPQLGPDGQPQLDPKTMQPVMASADDIVAIKCAMLNKELGRDGANVDLTVQQALFDVFMTSGIGPSKICYEADVKYIEPTPPMEQPGNVLNLNQPLPPPQPVVVNERRRWYHFSPEKLIIPVGFLSTDWDAAPYLGMEFETPFSEQAKREYNLPDDYRPTNATNDRPLSSDNDRASQTTQKVIKGVEIWLHAAEYDPNEPDKDVFYRLVLIEGIKDRPAVYALSPYQDKGLNGRLTPDSMIGNPIHPFSLRVGGETAWVKSDAAFTNPLVNIENIQESQDALIRESNIPRFLHATSLSDAIDKLRNAGTGQGVAVDDALMMRIAQLVFPLPHLDRAQSDIQGREHNRQAITETLGLGANQAGAYNDTRKSATETAIVAQSVSARLQGERSALLSRVMQGVRKYDSLIQRYETEQGYVQVVGPLGAQKLTAYSNAHLAGRFAYDAHPDSQLTIDQATRIKRATDFVNFLAKSPSIDQTGLARIATLAFGYNAAELVHPPPAPPPPAPSGSVAVKAEDLAIPEFRQMLSILYPQLAQVFAGPISTEAISAALAAQTPAPQHGGGQPLADTVSKHKAEQTGNQVGTPPLAGNPAPTPDIMQPHRVIQ